MRVRGVLEQEDAVLVAQPPQLVDGGCHEPADVHDDEPGGVGPDGGSDSFGSTAIVAGSQSTNLGRAPAAMTAGSRGEERVRGDQHLAAVDRTAERSHGPERDLDGARAGVDGDRVLRAVVRGEPFLELPADRPEGELPGGQRLVDAAQDLGAVLRREVDLRWGHGQRGRGRAGRGAGSGHRVLRL